ncbi:MAG: MFS transporter [Burkholderiaceae bacterium]|jgi:MFS family permease|nr:MFS transporter [Burkholderiaceae bacterium]MCZ8174395.1 MFS transporter [Burkholderiaceae bacterium]
MALPAALQPLESPSFRGLWAAWLAANLTMWMNDVAAAWLMTSLTTSPVMVALVQAASTLPVFLLGLPSGALADIVDRRRWFAFTQLWVCVVALVLAAMSLSGRLTAGWLLALTFLNGVGLAMRWPVFAAIVPTVVSRAQFPQALALNGIAMNLSRVIGPVLAGALLAAVSPAAVFVLNALLALFAFWMIVRWKGAPRTSALPGERFVGAMRVGINYALQAPRLRLVLLRVFLFFVQSTALLALLPLVAQGLHGGGAGLFTVMLSCLGLGAVIAALYFPRWRARHTPNEFVVAGTLVHAAASALIVTVPEVWVALPAMVVAGMAWISVANSLTLAAQATMPDWVRARGMSIYQMALMGGAAAGALLWGQVAVFTGVNGAVLAASAFGVLGAVALRRTSIVAEVMPDFSPARVSPAPEPATPVDDDAGPVMVTVEYRIDPARTAEFSAVMERTRRARLRQGALSWGLFHDVAQPGRCVEVFVDESWLEHQRRLERFTAFDAELREQRLAFHQGPEPPRLSRFVADGRAAPPDP